MKKISGRNDEAQPQRLYRRINVLCGIQKKWLKACRSGRGGWIGFWDVAEDQRLRKCD
ncbi:MAG: hypothetical protein L7W43_15160 [Rubripirellula sp.]|nr:hypothetical protein [Rubripirellula sp.]